MMQLGPLTVVEMGKMSDVFLFKKKICHSFVCTAVISCDL